MNRKNLIIVILAILFCANNSYTFATGKPIRVFLGNDALMENNVGSTTEGIALDKQLNQYVRNIINNKKGFVVSGKKINLDKLSFFEFLDFLKGFNSIDYYGAELYLLVGDFNDKSSPDEQIMLVGTETGKSVNIGNMGVESPKEILSSPAKKELLKEKINKLLDYAPQLLNVKADKIISSKWSIVGYELLAESNDSIWVEIDFTDGEEEEPQNVAFVLHDSKQNGEYEYLILTREGYKLRIKFWYQNNKIVQVKIDVDYKPLERKPQPQQKTFSAVSRNGYVLNFTFDWDQNGELVVVKVRPGQHPYLPRFVTLE